MSPKLTTIRAVHGTPRRKTSDKFKARAIFDSLTDVFNDTAAPTLVLETGKDSSSLLASIEQKCADWADGHGIRVVQFTLAQACTEVSGEPRLAVTTQRITSRYPALAERLLNTNGNLTRDAERWRHLRPLVVAFVLAHAFAARSVIDAFGGLIPPHPRNYD